MLDRVGVVLPLLLSISNPEKDCGTQVSVFQSKLSDRILLFVQSRYQ